jgi:hypothetical protein
MLALTTQRSSWFAPNTRSGAHGGPAAEQVHYGVRRLCDIPVNEMPDSQVLDLFRTLDTADSGVVEFTELQAFIEGPQWISVLGNVGPAPLGGDEAGSFHRRPLDELTELVRIGIDAKSLLSSTLKSQLRSESVTVADVQGSLRSLELPALSDSTIAAVFDVLSRY